MTAMDQTDHGSQSDGVRHEADNRLVHALLVHLHDSQVAEHRNQRVQRVMEAIRASSVQVQEDQDTRVIAPTSGSPLIRLWARRGAWAVAAMIVLAVGVFQIMPQTAAMASLDSVLSALAQPGDRTFRIRVEMSPGGGSHPVGGQPPHGEQQRPGLDHATLYLRNGLQFVLVRKDPKGGELFDGYNGRQSWRIRANALTECREGPGAGGIPMPQMMADIPFIDLQGTLQRIRSDYIINRFGSEHLPTGGGLGLHLVARRKSHDVKGPETIEIRADAATGMPKQIVFEGAKFQGSPEPRRLTFELISEEALPVAWFSPAPHLMSGDR